jgi:hypothetical protein
MSPVALRGISAPAILFKAYTNEIYNAPLADAPGISSGEDGKFIERE